MFAESDGSGDVENNWIAGADSAGASNSNYNFRINPSNNTSLDNFVLTRNGRMGLGKFPGLTGIESQQVLIFNSNSEGIVVGNCNYGNNQDADYNSIAGTQVWTGATTNWGSYAI